MDCLFKRIYEVMLKSREKERDGTMGAYGDKEKPNKREGMA